MKLLKRHVLGLDHKKTKNIAVKALAPDHLLHGLHCDRRVGLCSRILRNGRNRFLRHIVQYPALFFGISSTLCRNDGTEVIRFIKNVYDPIVSGFSGFKPLNIHEADLRGAPLLISLNVTHPNTGIQFLSCKIRTADIQFQLLGKALRRRSDHISK